MFPHPLKILHMLDLRKYGMNNNKKEEEVLS